ncbi:MAG: TIGR01841 family phasin [Alphaproteobacteria bacterium]|nr:TIGR01841 family phasin [Alphaproteobacteria bacterium]
MATPAKASAKRTSPSKAAAKPAKTSDVAIAAAGERTWTMTEETVKQTAQDFGAKATEMLHDLSTKAKAAFEKTGEFSKEATEFHKANLEAVVESGKLAAKGLQDVAQHGAEVGKARWEAATAHAKTLAAVTSPTEFMSVQGDYLRKQFDAAVADFSKSTEFYMKLAGEIVAPVQNRYAAAAEQVKARFAA